MSRLTDRKQSILDSAARARGQWTPSPHSRHYQMYVDFHKRKRIAVPKRGRCDYFHKVIRQAFYEARRFFLGLLVVLLGSGLLYLFLNYPTRMLGIVGLLGFVAYMAYGMFLSAHIAGRIAPDLVGESPFPMRWYDGLAKTLQVLLVILVIPAGIGLLAALISLSVVGGASLLIGAFLSVFKGPARWFFFEQPFGRRGFIWIRPWMIVASIALVVVSITVPGFFQAAYIPVLLVIGFAVLMTSILFTAFLISAKWEERRGEHEDAYEAAHVAFLARGAMPQLFAFQHPEWMIDGAPDTAKYANWAVRYDTYCQRTFGQPCEKVEFWRHFRYIDGDQYLARFNESLTSLNVRLTYEFRQQYPAVEKRRRWYHTLIELLGVAWAGLRAAKQRVCPIVIYPPDAV